MNYAEIASTLLMIIGGVTILTNLIVQVFKTVTWDKIPTNFLALIVAEVLTLASGLCTDSGDHNYLVSGVRGYRGWTSVCLCGHAGVRQADRSA